MFFLAHPQFFVEKQQHHKFDITIKFKHLNFSKKKADSKATGVLAMRRAKIFNYYNKRPHKGTEQIIE